MLTMCMMKGDQNHSMLHFSYAFAVCLNPCRQERRALRACLQPHSSVGSLKADRIEPGMTDPLPYSSPREVAYLVEER